MSAPMTGSINPITMRIFDRTLREVERDVVGVKTPGEIVDMGRRIPELRSQVSRALWTLKRFKADLDNISESNRLKAEAKEARSQIQSREGTDEDSDAGFARIVTWLLI